MKVIALGSGRCSSFGGPKDTGVGPQEGLSCVDESDLSDEWFGKLFLADRGGLGLARSLNPDALYIAMRWAYGEFAGTYGEILVGYTREQVRRMAFCLEANNRMTYAQAADWGPNKDTGRLVDCSPGVLRFLGVATDSIVTVSAITE